MTTLLEQGILAAKNGQQAAARQILTQVLKQDNRNEQAWLWLSDVVDTLGEQIACIEQVLEINPHNRTAQLALKKLKSQPTTRLRPASPPEPASVAGHASEQRRPFRLSNGSAPDPAAPPAADLPHQATLGTSANPLPMPDERQYGPAAAEAASRPSKGLLRKPSAAHKPAVNGHRPQKSTPQSFEPDGLPLLPVVLFGTLSVTAIGGLLMIVLLLILS